VPVCFTDEETGEVLADVTATLVPVSSSFEAIPNDQDGDVFVVSERVKTKGTLLISDIEGKAVYKGKINEAFYFNAVKEGYETKDVVIPAAELASGEAACIPLKKVEAKFIPFSGFVQSRVTKRGIPSASVTILDKCNDRTTSVEADINGFFEYIMVCGCEYEVVGTKSNYTEGTTITTADCVNNNRILTYVELDPLSEEPSNYDYVPGAPAFEIGQIIVLEDLYYDFDKYYIRSDASVELDKVVALMQQFPSLELELGSHTDCRGTTSYNNRLSKNRAKSAVEYIISRGISKNRITAAGYGERVLTNHCADGVKCEEEEHQRNRRTEIKVTRFDGDNIRLRDQHGFSN